CLCNTPRTISGSGSFSSPGSGSGSGSSSSSGFGSGSDSGLPSSGKTLLRFRPRFPLPLTTSLAARAARAATISSKLITFPWPFPSTIDLVDLRTLASLFIFFNSCFS
ncbi:uncharacterized protein K444DRAFT_235983, partial [Hyaloscypha bicolor E]